MKRRSVLAITLLPALACAQGVDSRTYTPGSFEGVEIAGAAAVQFTQGAQDQVVVEGDEDAQRAVELEVRGGLLTIRPAGNWKFWNSRRLQLQVTARELKRVSISGAADFVAPAPVQAGRLVVSISGAGLARFDQLRADQLSFTVSGAGDGQFAGRARTLAINVSGKSEFRGEQLHAESAQVRVSGIGNVKTWVTGDLNVSVSGIGTVDFWGSPQVQRQASGISRVNDHGPKPAP
jgi:hypothetical protein